MYDLNVTVTKVLGTCTADPPMKPGDRFTVCDGDIRIPGGGSVCLWALHSLLPIITLKEREIAEKPDEDWVWRVHHIQCPDPDGRVILKIERQESMVGVRKEDTPVPMSAESRMMEDAQGVSGSLKTLRVVVEEVRGKCTSGMAPGDYVLLRGGRLYIPPERHFCLYALQAVLPFLPAKQRSLDDGDWLKKADRVICPDPAGNVILRIESYP